MRRRILIHHRTRPTRGSTNPVVSARAARPALLALVTASLLVASVGAGPARAEDPPAHDDFANAQSVTAPSFTETLSTAGATSESDEPWLESCSVGNTVWYRLVPDQDLLVSANTSGSDFDTVLLVWEGTSTTTLQAVTCNDDAAPGATPPDRTSAVGEFAARAGQSYYFQVGGYYDAASETAATGNLTVTIQTRPANDDFADAVALSGANGSASGNNEGATAEADEPAHDEADPGGASVWYGWTAPSSQSVTFDTLAGSLDSLLAVYTGDSLSALTPVAKNDDVDVSTPQSSVTFAAVEGTQYWIAVDGHAGGGDPAQGDFTLTWALSTPTSADLSIDKSAAAGTDGEVTYTLIVDNAGPDTATAVNVTDSLPAQLDYVSAESSVGSCQFETPVVGCNLGDVAVADPSVTVTIVATANTSGTIDNTASVGSETGDPDTDDNEDSASVFVEPPPPPESDLSVTVSADASPGGPHFSYVATVTNAVGSDPAEQVVATVYLPPEVDHVSTDSTVEGCSGAPTIVCELGDLAGGAQATVTVVVAPRGPGPSTADALVETETQDADPADDFAHGTAEPSLICGSLLGDETNDFLAGGPGDDVLCGLEGNDRLKGGPGDDLLFGGEGTDTAVYSGTQPMEIDLRVQDLAGASAHPRKTATGPGDGSDRFTEVEQAKGTRKADVLRGSSSGDRLWGRGGDDDIRTFAGFDQLIGGRGDDALRGGSGKDLVKGGAGRDLCRDRFDIRRRCER